MLEITKQRLQKHEEDHKRKNRLYAMSKEEIEAITEYELSRMHLNSTEAAYRGMILGMEHYTRYNKKFNKKGQMFDPDGTLVMEDIKNLSMWGT